jgi:predicted Kef-type K+ transport protein
VIQIFSDEKRLGSQSGRTSFAILLFQDLAVIPILLMVSVLGKESSGPVLQGIAIALAQAAVAIALIIGVGRFALRPLLRLVAGINSSDLFMAAVLLIAVGTGVLANLAGLSMALGAFRGLTRLKPNTAAPSKPLSSPSRACCLAPSSCSWASASTSTASLRPRCKFSPSQQQLSLQNRR